VTGACLTGTQDFEQLKSRGHRIGGWAKSCLFSDGSDSYDQRHRLDEGREYAIALVPTKEITGERTTESARLQMLKRYGYETPPAGVVPRLRALISDALMRDMGFWYIAALHEPIRDSDGEPSVLLLERFVDGAWLDAEADPPGHQWDEFGAFAFLISSHGSRGYGT
jgi:hypothetical protein